MAGLEVIQLRRIDPYAEAVQVTEDNLDEIIDWVHSNGGGIARKESLGQTVLLSIEQTEYDKHYASTGDYVIHNESGNMAVYGQRHLYDWYEAI